MPRKTIRIVRERVLTDVPGRAPAEYFLKLSPSTPRALRMKSSSRLGDAYL